METQKLKISDFILMFLTHVKSVDNTEMSHVVTEWKRQRLRLFLLFSNVVSCVFNVIRIVLILW